MRLYALLSLALFCVLARGATILDIAGTPSETKIDKSPVHEEEQLDQGKLINDVDNKLRLKPADLPVKVIAENANLVLKSSAEKDEPEEIVRPLIDLKNPGIPQRQEHNSQSHEIYAAEIDLVEIYKKNINEAQAILRQGFQNMNDDIQNIFEKNERVKTIQRNIQSLRDGFIAEINKLDGTIQNQISDTCTNTNSPSEQQTKANLKQLKTGLNTLRDEFTKRVNTIADGVESYVALRAEASVRENPSSVANPTTTNPVQDYVNTLRQLFENFPFPWSQGQQTPTGGIPPDAVQFDAESAAPSSPWSNIVWPSSNPFTNLFGQGPQNDEQTQQTGAIGSGNGPLIQAFNTIQNIWQSATSSGQSPQSASFAKPVFSDIVNTFSESTQSESNPETQPAETNSDTQNNQVETTTLGPIRQILQNNPITQRIVIAVQALQNLNNPDKPKEPMKDKPTEPVKDKPVEPMKEKPVEPMKEKPVEPMKEKPVEPMKEKPVEPMKEKPVEPMDEKPVAPVKGPVEPVKEKPVTEEPVEGLEEKEKWQRPGFEDTNNMANGLKVNEFAPEVNKETLISEEKKPQKYQKDEMMTNRHRFDKTE